MINPAEFDRDLQRHRVTMARAEGRDVSRGRASGISETRAIFDLALPMARWVIQQRRRGRNEAALTASDHYHAAKAKRGIDDREILALARTTSTMLKQRLARWRREERARTD
jgi:hypothetical protein